MNPELAKLYEMIEDLEIAMMTTRRADGHLVSRPMETQPPRAECDLWLAAYEDAHFIEEIERDPNVCLAYQGNDEWISVSGSARVIHEGGGAAHIEITVETAVRFVGRVAELVYERERLEPVAAEDFFG